MKFNRWDFVGILSLLWFPVGLLLLTLSVIVWGPIIYVGGTLFRSDKLMNFLIRGWCVPIPSYFFIRHKVHYPPQFSDSYSVKRPCVLVCNHQSLFDIPAAYLAFPGNIRMLAKDSLFRIPIFGPAAKAAGHVKIIRGDRASGRQAIEGLRKRLKSGLQMWIAPEGTRSLEWKMGPFKPGGFSIALDMELPLQPMIVLNGFQILGRKNWVPRIFSTLEVLVLPPVDPKALGINDRVQLAQHVWTLMNAALEKHWKAQ